MIFRQIVAYLDPRVAYTRSRNTAVQFSYVGIVIQALLCLYFVCHYLVNQPQDHIFTIIVNFICAFSLLDLGITFLRGRSFSRIWAGGYCIFQGFYYYGLLSDRWSESNIPSIVSTVGLLSCALTVYLLSQKSVTIYLKEINDSNRF